MGARPCRAQRESIHRRHLAQHEMSSNGRKRQKLALDPDHVSTCFVTVETLELFRSKHV